MLRFKHIALVVCLAFIVHASHAQAELSGDELRQQIDGWFNEFSSANEARNQEVATSLGALLAHHPEARSPTMLRLMRSVDRADFTAERRTALLTLIEIATYGDQDERDQIGTFLVKYFNSQQASLMDVARKGLDQLSEIYPEMKQYIAKGWLERYPHQADAFDKIETLKEVAKLGQYGNPAIPVVADILKDAHANANLAEQAMETLRLTGAATDEVSAVLFHVVKNSYNANLRKEAIRVMEEMQVQVEIYDDALYHMSQHDPLPALREIARHKLEVLDQTLEQKK